MDNGQAFPYWVNFTHDEAERITFGALPGLMACTLHMFDGFACAAAEMGLESELVALVDSGKLTVRDPLTGGRHSFPIGEALRRALVFPEDLRELLAKYRIGLRIVTAVEQPARAAPIDPGVLNLPQGAYLKLSSNIGGIISSRSYPLASEYIELETQRIERQACGFFTVGEAAQILADTYPNLVAREMGERILLSFATTGLPPVRESGSRYPLLDRHQRSTVDNLVKDSEIDAWLVQMGTGDRWPLPREHNPELQTPMARGSAAEPKEAAHSPANAIIHRLRGRRNELSSLVERAKAGIPDSEDWPSAWLVLVAWAQSSDRPKPLLGYTEGEGVKYETGDDSKPVEFLNRNAFAARWRRAAKRR